MQIRVPCLALAPVPMGVRPALVDVKLHALVVLVVARAVVEIAVEVAVDVVVALVHLKRRELWMK